MRATFVHTADNHLGYEQYGFKARFNDFATAFYSVIDDAIARKADLVIIAGDLFNKRRRKAGWPTGILITDALHVPHNFQVINVSGAPGPEILVRVMKAWLLTKENGKWTVAHLGVGDQSNPSKNRGSSEIKLGKLKTARVTSGRSSRGMGTRWWCTPSRRVRKIGLGGCWMTSCSGGTQCHARIWMAMEMKSW